MSKARDTIPAPPINPSTGELVTYEQLAFRFDGIDTELRDVKHVMLKHFGEIGMRLHEDAKERKELLEQVLELARDNRRRIEELEARNEERDNARNGAHAQ